MHSPDPDDVQKQFTLRRSQHRAENNSESSSRTTAKLQRPVLPGWQLPSLDFRPFSLISSIQCPSDRPRTSTGIASHLCTDVISPTPERPMSSQSRKRFSRILDFDEACSGPDPKPVNRSFNSLNFENLKRVDEIPESSYPIRFSIPPFSPQKAVLVNGCTASPDVGATHTPNVISSEHTKHETSTIESLLDRHIEALGLTPEKTDAENGLSDHDVGIRFPSGATDDTFKDLTARLAKRNIARSHSLATVPSNIRSSLGSPERRRLMPRRLFASVDMSFAKLPSLQSAPHFPGPVARQIGADRPSHGWQTLASSSQLNSVPAISKISAREAERDFDQDADGLKRFKIRRRSALSLSPTSSSGWSQSAQDLSHWGEEVRTHRRPREKVDRQASHRRRQRIRLKLKRNSQSLVSITVKEVAGGLDIVSANPDNPASPIEEAWYTNSMNGPAELDSQPISFPHKHEEALVEDMGNKPTSPRIPHRWSSLINLVQQPIKRSIDVTRKPSVRTMRSHPSISSLAEPINSTRFAAQTPHMVSQVSISLLSPPDLGPPLHASTLNLSIPYAPVPSTVRPTLRETQSFFSEGSSGLHNKPGTSGGTGTLRRKLGLHSLRKIIPTSPRASVAQRTIGTKGQASRVHVHHSCNNIGGDKKSFDEDAPPDGTVGMSDSAYRKRRMMQKVKDWWMRQCVQKKLAGTLRRKKSTH